MLFLAALCFVNGASFAQVTDLPKISQPEQNRSSKSNVPNAVPSPQPSMANKNGLKALNSRSVNGDGISSSDRAMIAKACRGAQHSGPVVFHECERKQTEAARNATKAVFVGVSSDDRVSIAKACRPVQYSGAAAFHACERKQVASLKNSPAASFEGIDPADRALIAKACRGKKYWGPAAFHDCQRLQVSQLRAMQNTTSGKRP